MTETPFVVLLQSKVYQLLELPFSEPNISRSSPTEMIQSRVAYPGAAGVFPHGDLRTQEFSMWVLHSSCWSFRIRWVTHHTHTAFARVSHFRIIKCRCWRQGTSGSIDPVLVSFHYNSPIHGSQHRDGKVVDNNLLSVFIDIPSWVISYEWDLVTLWSFIIGFFHNWSRCVLYLFHTAS